MSQKLFDKMHWSTIIDMEHKLIIHVAPLVKEYRVDENKCDPDGVPLLFITHEKITRVRKMTEKEFEEAAKEFGYSYEINMVYAPEREKKKEEEKKEEEKKNESVKKGMAHKT